MQATFIGPHQTMTFGGLHFTKGETRPVPDDVAERLRSHPWFRVDGEAEPKRRGRPRKVA